jgi:ubiquinone/menaquinone biosynthesis C-methylase UbiE
MADGAANLDPAVAAGFGDEWSRFDQSDLADSDRREMFERYFAVFPWSDLPPDAAGADIGCGSGRWANLVAARVGSLICIDPSAEALAVARRNLAAHENCAFLHASADSMPIADGALDFAYALGVLHHAPDTAAAMAASVRKLRPGAPFLVYLYYAFDNRPAWYRLLWKASDVVRRAVSRCPHPLRYGLSQVLAFGVYWPVARLARLAERLGADVTHWPLAFYRDRSLYVLRTDALDRFGTRLEHRFSRAEIEAMMRAAGLTNIRFSPAAPFWTAVGVRA